MGFSPGEDPKEISKRNKIIGDRIFRETGERVGFVASQPITIETGRGSFPVPTNIPPRSKLTGNIFDVGDERGFGNFFPSRSPAKAIDSVTLGDPTESRKRRSKIKGKKNGKKKNGKAKQKPLKSIFDLSF